MIVSSNIGYEALLIDPRLSARSTQIIDQFDLKTPSPQSADTISQSAAAAQSEGLLSSSTASELLSMTDTALVDSGTVRKPWTITQEDILKAVKESKAYSSGNSSAAYQLGYNYTSKDVGFIRATTGYNIISIRGLTAVVDDGGNGPPSEELQNSLTQMTSAIEMGRMSGALTGEITPEYAKNMISTYAGLIKSFPGDWLDKALSYLDDTTDSQPARV
ncbi:hypothetical protein [Sphingomonas sp. CFBP 8760]|uniref:hypothetical protein n=1 Tax=Sphingomonas sp. CFBP 8760 TaxID=2775282 RepID=UPI00177EEDD2|nr:hypothetical protein [Sphingomonas sp. CFBP 8760]MBD8546666.1 hypothetical protein [Sphingomonas sp. CFBP 8760]